MTLPDYFDETLHSIRHDAEIPNRLQKLDNIQAQIVWIFAHGRRDADFDWIYVETEGKDRTFTISDLEHWHHRCSEIRNDIMTTETLKMALA